MKFCHRCGKEIMEEAVICTHCGCATDVFYQRKNTSEDKGSPGWSVLGFFLPLIGLILYLVWRDTHPNDASQAGKGALAGFITGIVFYLVFVLAVGTDASLYH